MRRRFYQTELLKDWYKLSKRGEEARKMLSEEHPEYFNRDTI